MNLTGIRPVIDRNKSSQGLHTTGNKQPLGEKECKNTLSTCIRPVVDQTTTRRPTSSTGIRPGIDRHTTGSAPSSTRNKQPLGEREYKNTLSTGIRPEHDRENCVLDWEQTTIGRERVC